MDPWLGWASIIFSAGAIITSAWFGLRGKRGETAVAAESAKEEAFASRFDDASQLAQYIRTEVERQVAPIKTEFHEFTNAVRARETQLWLWDLQGRAGQLPMLPGPILQRLGLAQLFGLPMEDTEPVKRKEESP